MVLMRIMKNVVVSIMFVCISEHGLQQRNKQKLCVCLCVCKKKRNVCLGLQK